MAEPEHPAFDKFVETVAKLRSPDGGCPWNRAQTHASLGDYLIEEAYEALDAIQGNDARHLREELGDVLLQVVLQSQIAAEAGEFTIDDVCATIDEKMIRRHPHVFGDLKAENANEVSELWEQVKLAEKAQKATHAQVAPSGQGQCSAEGDANSEDRAHLLDDIPVRFPALLQAQKISRKAVAAGFEWESLDEVWDKVAEERAELEVAYAAAPKTSDGKILREAIRVEDAASSEQAAYAVTDAEMEFGDLLFSLVNVARKMGIDAESALRASNAKFRKRFGCIEQAAWGEGREVEDLTLEEMEFYWQRAK